MTLQMLLTALCGAALLGGLFAAVAGLVGWADRESARRRGPLERRAVRLWLRATQGGSVSGTRRLRALGVAALAAMVVVWAVTGIPVAGVIVGITVLFGPALLRPGGNATKAIARLEALEHWVRRLGSIHEAGISLEQAIVRSLDTVPEPIAEPVTTLARRLTAGWRPADAYRALADELDDAAADSVCALLWLHANDHSSGLSQALLRQAKSTAEQVEMRRKIEADREKPRANARWLTVMCLGVFAVSLATHYITPYRTPVGQAVMAGLAVAFVAVLGWMRRMAALKPAPRILDRTTRTDSAADRQAGFEEAGR
ncbi:hypothetical protein BIV57_13385 [Mangrovactinospora gilvigrisea]|uniref:Type II secretion system protein GspF domain-containing protein n=1 Tax=Mangrovactinospora gilvigrisea TaxID=1428644 RepID=A0A1J7CBG4_9ACTN|nr:type II secretion system F family protein [Mangrovactinospora gilvigrisea]OIV36978.1 hypothetical protein BIV57_13385 [Mangrovactinospora gilvigrisea]